MLKTSILALGLTAASPAFAYTCDQTFNGGFQCHEDAQDHLQNNFNNFMNNRQAPMPNYLGDAINGATQNMSPRRGW